MFPERRPVRLVFSVIRLCTLACLFFAASVAAQGSVPDNLPGAPVNAGFESGGDAGDVPGGWTQPGVSPPTGGLGYNVTVDDSVARGGSRSACIRFIGPERSPWGYGSLTQAFSAADWRGKRIRLTGYVKTEDVAGAGAAVWLRVDGPYGYLADDSMTDRAITGTAGWTRCACVLDVSENATQIVFGAALEGDGTMWVDDLSIEAVGDDVATTAEVWVDDSAPGPEAFAWVDEHAIRFRTPEAGGGFDDLEPLREIIGDARIVGLGEGTHGTHEFFQMKHRLVEWLATEMGFTIFSIEASTPEAYRLNDYVLGGEGDPGRLIAGMYFWTWRTEEVLALVEWMREFNTSGRGRMQFTGFDMQTPDVAVQVVEAFLKEHDPDMYRVASHHYNDLKKNQRQAEFGVVTMSFPIDVARGKTVRYTGWIKTENVQDGFAGLWWRVDGEGRPAVAFDNMRDRGPTGTTDWTRYEIELDVAEEVTNINFGVILPGEGRAWFDDLEVTLDGEVYDPGDRFDFGFEKPAVEGYYASNTGAYRAALVDETAHSGRQSMRLEKVVSNPADKPAFELVGLTWSVLDGMRAARDRYLGVAPQEEVDWAIHNARIVNQYARMKAGRAGDTRDRSMAENVMWILEQNPDDKIVLWAHNGHIEREKHRMGYFLDEEYGEDYLPVGFAAGAGEYVAVGDGTLGKHPLLPPPPGSIEDILGSTGEARLILDLRTAGDEPAAGWLREPRLFRSIGAMAHEYQFHPHVIADRFDVLIYFRDTTPAVQLGTVETQ